MKKNNTSFEQIASLLRSNQTFAVMSHLRPDGDALGCSIALGASLLEMGKSVSVWNADGLPDKFQFLPCSHLVQVPPSTPVDVDVAIALDTGTQVRLGSSLDAIRSAKVWLNLDHHISNDHYGDLAYIDATAPATGQILFEFLESQGFPINEQIAANLFAAISTDTGSFQYPNTSAQTFRIASKLLEAGARVGELSVQLYERQPRRRLSLVREMLNAMKFHCDHRAASYTLSLERAAALNVKPEDTEGLIDIMRSVDGVQVAAFIEETIEGKIRFSLRSKDSRIDVCKICKQFGGGGHTLAAGARTTGQLAEVEEKVIQSICHEISQF